MKNQLTVRELLEGVENSYNKYFINSRCIATLDTNLYNSISVRILLSKDNTEVANRIWQNDMFSISFLIDSVGRELDNDITLDSILPDDLQIKIIDSSYLIKSENDYLCYSRRKLSYRKTKGNAKKLITTFDKWFKKLSDELKKDIENNNIHDSYIELLKSKIN